MFPLILSLTVHNWHSLLVKAYCFIIHNQFSYCLNIFQNIWIQFLLPLRQKCSVGFVLWRPSIMMHFVRRQTIVIHHFITPKQHRKNFICPRQRDGILSLKTFWIKVLLKWHYFVFPGKTCSCQCLTKVAWEPTEKPLGECLAGCDVEQTISVIDWGLFYIKNRRVLCDFILLIGISFYHYNISKQRWNGRLCFLSSLFISRETPFSLHRIVNTFAKCV